VWRAADDQECWAQPDRPADRRKRRRGGLAVLGLDRGDLGLAVLQIGLAQRHIGIDRRGLERLQFRIGLGRRSSALSVASTTPKVESERAS
jgi:hypothetical protein